MICCQMEWLFLEAKAEKENLQKQISFFFYYVLLKFSYFISSYCKAFCSVSLNMSPFSPPITSTSHITTDNKSFEHVSTSRMGRPITITITITSTLYCLLFLLSSFTLLRTSDSCPRGEADTLLHYMDAMHITSLEDLSYTNRNCCHWEEVSCDVVSAMCSMRHYLIQCKV